MDKRKEYYENGIQFVELEGEVNGNDVYARFYFEDGWTLNRIDVGGRNVAPSEHTETAREIAARNNIDW